MTRTRRTPRCGSRSHPARSSARPFDRTLRAAPTPLASALALVLSAPAAAQEAGRVDRLILVDSRSGEPIAEIGNGSTVSTDQFQNADIQAVVDSGSAASVVFLVDGQEQTIDSTAPFTLSGAGAGFANVTLPEGQVTIQAIPFTRSGGTGVRGLSLTSQLNASPNGTGEGGEDNSDFNLDAESETETESEISVQAVRGIAGSSQAHGRGGGGVGQQRRGPHRHLRFAVDLGERGSGTRLERRHRRRHHLGNRTRPVGRAQRWQRRHLRSGQRPGRQARSRSRPRHAACSRRGRERIDPECRGRGGSGNRGRGRGWRRPRCSGGQCGRVRRSSRGRCQHLPARGRAGAADRAQDPHRHGPGQLHLDRHGGDPAGPGHGW